MASFDHRDLWASLPADARQELLRQTNGQAFMRLVFYLSIIGGLAIWVATGWYGWLLGLMPLGVLLVFLFTLMHETTHKTAFANDRMNVWVASVCGFVLVIPPLWFRYFHFAHHRHTQDPDNDPELEDGKPETVWQYIKHISGIPLWVALVKVLLANALDGKLGRYVPTKAHARVRREARIMLSLYAAVLAVSIGLQSGFLIWVWLIPALIGQPFLRLYLLAEHGRCPMVSNMLENTRTTFTNSIVRFLAWNMPYHAEHHAVPTVPFHQLPHLHSLTAQHLLTTSNGYAEFNQDYVAHIVGASE